MTVGDKVYIADKATQDLIKQDTTGILGNFPISGGTDWSGKTAKTSGGNAYQTSYSTILSVTGSGYLNAIHYSAGSYYPEIPVFIDGIEYAGINKPINFGSTSIHTFVLGNARFNSSFEIKIDDNNLSHSKYAQVSYILD